MLNRNRNRKILCLIILFLATVTVSGRHIYKTYYQIDLSLFGYQRLAYVRESPDEKKRADVWVVKETYNSDISYILIRLREQPSQIVDGKPIYWQEITSDSLRHVEDDGSVDEYWMDFYWVGANTIYINGLTLNVDTEYFDYRRGVSAIPLVVSIGGHY